MDELREKLARVEEINGPLSEFHLRRRPMKSGGTLYWWNGRHRHNGYGSAVFYSEEQAQAFHKYNLTALTKDTDNG